MAKPKADDRQAIAAEHSPVVLLVIDVINDLEFPGGEDFVDQLPAFTRNLARLRKRARDAGIATVYVNDNFGRWRSDMRQLVTHCSRAHTRGCTMVHKLRPTRRDYFVLKPRHSGFHSSVLGTLLEYLHARTVILTGIAGDNCVLFTAGDAYMRHLKLIVPADCTISSDAESNRQALELMHRELKADIRESKDLDLEKLVRR